MAKKGVIMIFGGSSHPELTKLVADKVGAVIGNVKLGQFSNKETEVEVQECVRGREVYVVQTAGGKNPNDSLMELLLIINALKFSVASSVVVITPFFFYSKSVLKDGHRVPITSKLVGAMLKSAGGDHLMLLDPHTPHFEGFFDILVDTLRADRLYADWIRLNLKDWKEWIVLSPGDDGTRRALTFAHGLGLEFGVLTNTRKDEGFSSKRRASSADRSRNLSTAESTRSRSGSRKSSIVSQHERSRKEISGSTSSICESQTGSCQESQDENRKSELISKDSTADDSQSEDETGSIRKLPSGHGFVSSSVRDRNVIIYDDIINTGITMLHALQTLKHFGATSVAILVTHGVFVEGTLDALEEFGDFIHALVVTNTVDQSQNLGRMGGKFHVIDVSDLIAEFIRRHHHHESMSVLETVKPYDTDQATDSDEGEEAEDEEPKPDETEESKADDSETTEEVKDDPDVNEEKLFDEGFEAPTVEQLREES